jgi:hypothetical protein
MERLSVSASIIIDLRLLRRPSHQAPATAPIVAIVLFKLKILAYIIGTPACPDISFRFNSHPFGEVFNLNI